IPFAKEICEIHSVGCVGRIRIEGPFDVSDATVFSVMSAMRGQRYKVFTDNIRHEHGCAAALAVDKRCFEHLAKFMFVGHVHDSVVDEYPVEDTAEPDTSHIAHQMLAFGV